MPSFALLNQNTTEITAKLQGMTVFTINFFQKTGRKARLQIHNCA